MKHIWNHQLGNNKVNLSRSSVFFPMFHPAGPSFVANLRHLPEILTVGHRYPPMWEKKTAFKNKPSLRKPGKKTSSQKAAQHFWTVFFCFYYLGRVSFAKNWWHTTNYIGISVRFFWHFMSRRLVGNMTGMFVDARYSTNKYQQHIFGQIIIFHQPRFPWHKWNSIPKWGGGEESVVFLCFWCLMCSEFRRPFSQIQQNLGFLTLQNVSTYKGYNRGFPFIRAIYKGIIFLPHLVATKNHVHPFLGFVLLLLSVKKTIPRIFHEQCLSVSDLFVDPAITGALAAMRRNMPEK